MKRKTLATIVITMLLLLMMAWSFGSSAAKNENEPDADLGKFGSRINREAYLEARDEYVARKRGIEPGQYFDPTMRGRAIEQMDRQEKNSRLESIINSDLTPAAGGAWAP